MTCNKQKSLYLFVHWGICTLRYISLLPYVKAEIGEQLSITNSFWSIFEPPDTSEHNIEPPTQLQRLCQEFTVSKPVSSIAQRCHYNFNKSFGQHQHSFCYLSSLNINLYRTLNEGTGISVPLSHMINLQIHIYISLMRCHWTTRHKECFPFLIPYGFWGISTVK